MYEITRLRSIPTGVPQVINPTAMNLFLANVRLTKAILGTKRVPYPSPTHSPCVIGTSQYRELKERMNAPRILSAAPAYIIGL